LEAEGRLEEEVAVVLQQLEKQEGKEGRRQVQAEQVLKTSVDGDGDGDGGVGSERKNAAAAGAGGEESGVAESEDGSGGSSSKAAEAPKRNRPVRVE
ncbi:hypothetical protein CLOP_g782, partial [Closterium sp. NIES-67]